MIETKEMNMTENKNWCAERDCNSNSICGWCGYCEQHAVHDHPSGFTGSDGGDGWCSAFSEDADEEGGHQTDCVCADCADAELTADND